MARLRRTASTGLDSPPRLFSSDALGRELIVRDRVSLSDSEPDREETGAAGERPVDSSANAELRDTLRLLAPLSCCCWIPVSVVDTDEVEGRENVTPLVRVELLDPLLDSGKGAAPTSGDIVIVAVVSAMVGLDGLMAGVNGVGSGRIVMFELAEILRRLNLSAEELFWVAMSDSDGSVDRDGGTETEGNARRSVNTCDCLVIGVGEGS